MALFTFTTTLGLAACGGVTVGEPSERPVATPARAESTPDASRPDARREPDEPNPYYYDGGGGQPGYGLAPPYDASPPKPADAGSDATEEEYYDGGGPAVLYGLPQWDGG